MGRSVGIDLGTCNSVVCVLEGGEPTVITNAEGSRTTPSVVAFGSDGEVLVGEVARRQAVTNVERTICSVKRRLGTDWKIRIDGKPFVAQQISAFILLKLKRDAEAYLGEKVTDAVITVPAYVTDSERQATKEACEIAGLNVLRIVNEPTTAALAYGLDRAVGVQMIVVLDLGAGTLDVSLLEVSRDEDGFSTVEVKATNGDNHLGGDDWDQAVVDHLVVQFKNAHGADLSKDKMAMQRLREAGEVAKIELSSATETAINLPYITASAKGPLHLEETLTRAQFQQLTADLLNRCRASFAAVLRDSGYGVRDVDHVVLVGGSTRMPAVADLVRELTGGKEPNKGVNPDEVKDVLLLDVTPFDLGIETDGGVMKKLIDRNTTIPTKRSEIVTTTRDNQSVIRCKIYQGEHEQARRNKLVGTLELNWILPAPAGEPKVEITFDIDANGIVRASARDLTTGNQRVLVLTGSSALPEEEIERMRREMGRYAEVERDS